jgi:hypothetical protein
MHNAFVAAFARSLEGSISVRSVRQTLKGIGNDEQDPKKDEKKHKKDEEKKRGPRATG